jgi:Icc-related predicted phosphoesterase
MRIAFFVDIHNRFDSIPRALREIGTVDVLLIGGDITSGGSTESLSRAIESWRPLAPRLLAVAGNWDSPAIDIRLGELGVALDGRGLALGEVGLCGVSGSPLSAINAPYELEEEEILSRLERGFTEIEGCSVPVVCSHTPPIETSCDLAYSGEHIGSRAVRSFVEEHQLELVLCGHVHEGRGTDLIGKTRIVNPGPIAGGHYALVEIEEGKIEVSLDPS